MEEVESLCTSCGEQITAQSWDLRNNCARRFVLAGECYEDNFNHDPRLKEVDSCTYSRRLDTNIMGLRRTEHNLLNPHG